MEGNPLEKRESTPVQVRFTKPGAAGELTYVVAIVDGKPTILSWEGGIPDEYPGRKDLDDALAYGTHLLQEAMNSNIEGEHQDAILQQVAKEEREREAAAAAAQRGDYDQDDVPLFGHRGSDDEKKAA